MAFETLASGALDILADALDAGALRPPYAPGVLARWLDPREAAQAAADLQAFAALSVSDLARVLRLLARERRRAAEARTRVELVWSGPDTPGVASRDTAVVVRHLFQSARRSVLVASFAVYQGERLFRVLAERLDAEPELHVRLVLNVARESLDAAPDDGVVRRFAAQFFAREWPGTRRPAVFNAPRGPPPGGSGQRAVQHAKCVVIDDAEALVTSANFTEAAQERNIEAGVLVREPSFARSLREHFDALIASGALSRMEVRA